MELNPCWESTNCAATQELPSILWNSKIHYRVHKSPPMISIPSQTNPIHPIPSYLRSILILSTHLHLGPPSDLFPSGVSTNNLYAVLFPRSCYMPCPFHPPWRDHSSYVWLGAQVMKILNVHCSPTSRHFISLLSKYSPQHPVLKHFRSMSLP
jgi:hypothetical protein